MQSNSIYNTDSPQKVNYNRYIPPMWDADGKLLPFNTNETPIGIGADYDNTPIRQYQNGLVTGVSGMPGNTFQMFTENNNKEDTFKEYALSGIQNRSPLSELFFSKANMKIIQDRLRYRVFVASGGKYQIGPQDNTELEIIMRAIYLQHAKNLSYQLNKQVNELNRLVIDFSYPKILSEVEQYLGYLKNIEYLPTPIPLPKNMSSAGTRTLRSVTTTF